MEIKPQLAIALVMLALTAMQCPDNYIEQGDIHVTIAIDSICSGRRGFIKMPALDAIISGGQDGLTFPHTFRVLSGHYRFDVITWEGLDNYEDTEETTFILDIDRDTVLVLHCSPRPNLSVRAPSE